MNRQYPKINNHMLNHAIIKQFESKAEFARAGDFPVNQIYNWCDGHSSPSPENVVACGKLLGINPQEFYISGEEYFQSGVESALTRWAMEQKTAEAPTLTPNEALQFTKTKLPDSLEEVFKETREDEVTIPS